MVANLKDLGLDITLLEKNPDVGGVWRENYAEFGLQVPYELYEFPGFPYAPDENRDKFPRGDCVQKYIKRYATEKNVYDNAIFNTKVTSVERKGSGWELVHEGVSEGSKKETREFDFVVVCTGMYSTPLLVHFKDEDKFKGHITHATYFTDGEKACKDKNVVVVGGGKSAIDCAVVAAKYAKSSSIVFRGAHWPVPRKILNLVPFKWATYNRFGNFFLEGYYN